MVRIAPQSELEVSTTERTPTPIKAHGGFVVALMLAAPLAMVASFVLVGLAMGSAAGATGTAWVVGGALFGTMALAFLVSVILAEAHAQTE